MHTSPVRIEITPKGAAPVPTFYHQGTLYAVVPQFGGYDINLVNTSLRRALVVLTVDGRNTLTGSAGTQNDSGYVLKPGESWSIPGWKLASGAASFEFTSAAEAYASKIGAGHNVGVVGAAIFYEKYTPPPPQPHHHVHGSACRGGDTLGMPKSVSLEMTRSAAPTGTGFGSRVGFDSASTTFDREPTPCAVVSIQYRPRHWFASNGIPIPGDSHQQTAPSAFPADQGVPPPPGWNG